MASDSAALCAKIEQQLSENHYHVITAAHAKQAIDAVNSVQPDIMLLDMNIPLMSVPDLVAAIKTRTERMPVIILLLNEEPGALKYALLAGADDVLPAPHDMVLLKRKINTFHRLGFDPGDDVSELLSLRHEYDRLKYEFDMVELVYKHSTVYQNDSYPDLKLHMSPKAFANGDIFLIKRNAQGEWLFLFGDFSGHGLYAAMNAWPVGETFHAMVMRGCTIADIAAEINEKLVRLLPPQLYMAAVVGRVCANEDCLDIINAGMPEAALYNGGKQSVQYLSSTCQPLGVRQGEQYGDRIQSLLVTPGDYMYLCSDGLLEARSWDDEQFSEQGFREVFQAARQDSLFDTLLDRMQKFRAGKPQEDDVSLLELRLV